MEGKLKGHERVLYGSGLGGAGRAYGGGGGGGGRRKSGGGGGGVGVGSKRARPGDRSEDGGNSSGGFSSGSSSGDDSDRANVSGWGAGRRGGGSSETGALLCAVATDEYPDMQLREPVPPLAIRR